MPKHMPDTYETPDLDALMRDKLDTHCREQLSAMLDGELAPDEARFLLRRLQHDRDLAGCWERWQFSGDLMRGSAPALLPADFAERVCAALEGEADAADVRVQVAVNARARWVPWAGSAALAASVAAVALMVGRGVPQGADEVPSPDAIVAAASSTQPAPVPAPTQPERSPIGDTATVLSAVTAVAVTAGTGGQQSRSNQRSATRVRSGRDNSVLRRQADAQPLLPPDEGLAVAQDIGGAGPVTEHAPVASSQAPLLADVQPQARPWPRAVLPDWSASTYNAGLQSSVPDDGEAGYPMFEPRLLHSAHDVAAQTEAATP